MNGIHDMGGLHGFGRVEAEASEPVFRTRWEARVFAMMAILRRHMPNIDAGRHALERLGPVAYLRNGYYGRWLAAMEQSLAALAVVTADELRTRMRATRRRRTKGTRSARARRVPAGRAPAGTSYARTVDRAARFGNGQEVRTRNHQPHGHTRLPAYARCKRGRVEHVHPAMVYPDDHAHGRGENPQYLYTVRFEGRELWGDSAEPATTVSLDLFEPYLEPA
jgi:nitrile hydratase beta subunit